MYKVSGIEYLVYWDRDWIPVEYTGMTEKVGFRILVIIQLACTLYSG